MADENDTQGAKCSVCGICPAPFGICLFVAAGVIVGLILIISVLTHLRRLLQRKECPRCHKKCKQQEKPMPGVPLSLHDNHATDCGRRKYNGIQTREKHVA